MRSALLAFVLVASITACKRPAPCPKVVVPPEPILETAGLPDSATPEQTQEAQTMDLVRWVGYARQLRLLLRPYEATQKEKK